jgi:hypothetical protein
MWEVGMNIYCERQEGNLCRMHSLNNYFQRREMNKNKFYEYCELYDKFYGTRNSRSLDMFNEGRNIIGFILKEYYDTPTILAYDTNLIKKYLPRLSNIFAFSKSHIFLYKKINNDWYKIDSLSKPQKASPLQNHFGYIIVIPKDLFNSFENILIQQIIKSKIYNAANKIEFFKKNLLDDAEIPLCNLFNLSKKYKNVNKIITLFRKNKNNQSIPPILNNKLFLSTHPPA